MFKNKKYVLPFMIVLFIMVSITIIKTFYYHNETKRYNKLFNDSVNKQDNDIMVYSEENTVPVNANSSIENYISCIQSKTKVEELSNDVKKIILDIKSFYDNNSKYFAFKYIDLYTGFTVSYNEKQGIFAASAIKAPTDIYIYEMASQNKVDLSEKIKYTEKHYNTGTGVLKTKKIGTSYDIKTLLEYSIRYSDNAAHNMLMDKYGRENMLEFWTNLGTKSIFKVENNWGNVSAKDAGIYMQELYNFYKNDSEYGTLALNNFLNTSFKLITSKDGYKVANKSGWSGSSMHDASIVMADNPYVLVVLSNLGNDDNYSYYFNTVSNYASTLHNEYWKYKVNYCNKFKQYN